MDSLDGHWLIETLTTGGLAWDSLKYRQNLCRLRADAFHPSECHDGAAFTAKSCITEAAAMTRGKPSTNLANQLAANGFSITEAHRSRLGEALATTGYRFTRDFNWEAGDFGDGRSCFFTGLRPSVRPFMQARNNRFFAMQFYRGGKGFARCWGVHCPEGKTFFLFNSTCLPLAAIRASLFPTNSEMHSLAFSGVSNGTLWINNSHCLLVGARVQDYSRKRVDFRDELWGLEFKCPRCLYSWPRCFSLVEKTGAIVCEGCN